MSATNPRPFVTLTLSDGSEIKARLIDGDYHLDVADALALSELRAMNEKLDKILRVLLFQAGSVPTPEE